MSTYANRQDPSIVVPAQARVASFRPHLPSVPSYSRPSYESSLPASNSQVDVRRDRPAGTPAVSEPERQRRSSRFSTLSTTPTVVASAGVPPQPNIIDPRPGPSRPSAKELVKKHPRNVMYASILTLSFIGVIAGWVVYLNVRRNSDARSGWSGGLVVNALFVVVLIIIFILAGRQYTFLVRLCRPVTPNRASSLPPWLVGRPPTYSEALRVGGARRGTGDVEDGIIAQNESLPKYGDMAGSTLLARSQSRGQTVTQGDAGMLEMAERRTNSADRHTPADVRTETDNEARQIEEARELQANAGAPVPGNLGTRGGGTEKRGES